MVQKLKALKRVWTSHCLEVALNSNLYIIGRYDWALSSVLNRAPLNLIRMLNIITADQASVMNLIIDTE